MKRKKLELTITVIIYFITALVASTLAIQILSVWGKLMPEFLSGNMWTDAVMPAVIAESFAMVMALYDGKYSFEKAKFINYIVKALKGTLYFAGVWAVVLLIQKNSITESRYFFVVTITLHFMILWLSLYNAQKVIILNFYKTDAASLVAVITNRRHAPQATDILKGDWSRRVVGIMFAYEDRNNSEESVEVIDHVPVIAYRNDIIKCVRRNAIDEVFIFDIDNESNTVANLIEELAQMGVSVHLNLTSIEKLSEKLYVKTKKYIPKIETRLGFFGNHPMAILEPPSVKLRYEYIKRFIDIIGGIIGSIIALFLFVFVGIAIKLDSPGPVIFAQERIGKNGRRFKMYKFRSMYQDAEERKEALMVKNEMSGLMFKIKDDPRITRVGKFIRRTSIDEFPQFFNVVLGDMSLVGTRPPTVNEFNEYSNYHKRRLSMKPGITGMWQISGRSDVKDFEDVVRLDCKYIDNWSLRLDFEILIKTIMIVFLKKGSE